VPLLAETSATSVHAWLGVNLAGAADVPLNTAYRGASLAHGLGLGRARLMIAAPSFLPRIAEVAADLPALETVALLGGGTPPDLPLPASLRVIPLVTAADGPRPDGTVPDGDGVTCRDTASVLFTSGTTGPAKGVIMTHAQTYAIAQEIVDGLRITDRDVFYCFHPMFHMTRFGSVYTALLAGCPVLDRRFDPAAFLDRARRYGATATIGHGPMLEAIYRQPERPDDADNPLRTILTAPLPARIAQDFERRFGVRAIDVRPLEPWVVMQGYLGMPDLTVAAWRNFRFHSGDFGYLTPDGYLYFAERPGDRIRRRAENVSAYDIESAASVHPWVQDCAAVGVASSFESDDDIKLCVVPVPGRVPDEGGLDEADLIRHLVRALPRYMVPRYIEVLPELPRTPTNKIQRQVLRASGAGPGVWDRVAAGVSVRALSSPPAAREGEQ
jgi:crotonobetaine/carnitine-CoA ligase